MVLYMDGRGGLTNRDPLLGAEEAEKRRKYIPLIMEELEKILTVLGARVSKLELIGSVKENLCLPTSDIDINLRLGRGDYEVLETTEFKQWLTELKGLVPYRIEFNFF